jgi:hypothetical protein
MTVVKSFNNSMHAYQTLAVKYFIKVIFLAPKKVVEQMNNDANACEMFSDDRDILAKRYQH